MVVSKFWYKSWDKVLVSKLFLNIFTLKIGDMIQFDDHMFHVETANYSFLCGSQKDARSMIRSVMMMIIAIITTMINYIIMTSYV